MRMTVTANNSAVILNILIMTVILHVMLDVKLTAGLPTSRSRTGGVTWRP